MAEVARARAGARRARSSAAPPEPDACSSTQVREALGRLDAAGRRRPGASMAARSADGRLDRRGRCSASPAASPPPAVCTRPPRPRCSRSRRRATPRGRPSKSTDASRPAVGIQIPSSPSIVISRARRASLARHRASTARARSAPASTALVAAAAEDLAVVGVERREAHALGQRAVGVDREQHLVGALVREQRPVLGERADPGASSISGPTAERSTSRSAPRAANGHDGRGDDDRDREHPAAERGPPPVGRATARARRGRRWTPRPAAAPGRRSSCVRHASHSSATSSAAMPDRGLDAARRARPGRACSGALTVGAPEEQAEEHHAERDRRRGVRDAVLAPGQQRERAGPDEEHHERRHQQVAVRADRQIDRDEVLPRRAPRRRPASPRPRRSSAGPPSRDGHRQRDAEHEERDGEQRRPSSSRPSARRHASAAIAAATSDADADEQQEPPGAVDRPGGDRGDRDDGAAKTRPATMRGTRRRSRDRARARHPARCAHDVAPRSSRPERSSSVPTVSTVSPTAAACAGGRARRR